jgi:hypothetical protein
MKKSLTFSPGRSIKRFFTRFHTTLFMLAVLGGLVYATLMLASILNDASIGGDYQSPITAGSIDQVTLDRINSLHTSQDDLPSQPQTNGRVNPFAE